MPSQPIAETMWQLTAEAEGHVVGAVAQATLVRPLQVPLWIDLAAVVVGALAGAGIAARERFDLIGALLLAVVMGLGGGIVRDLLLGLRPVAITSRYYLPAAVAAAVAGFVFTSLVRRFGALFVVLEALSVGLFTVVGVEKTLLYDLPYATAILVGVAAAAGGGVLVDLIAGRPVEVIRQGPWNATAALAGAGVYVVSEILGAPTGASQAAAFSVVVGMRLAALRWGLRTPLPADSGSKLAAGRRDRKGGPGAEDTPELPRRRTWRARCYSVQGRAARTAMCRDMSVPSRLARVPAWPARTTGRTSSLLAPDSASYAWPGTDGHSGWRVRARPCHFRFRLAKRWLASASRSAAIGPAVGKSTYKTLANAGSSARNSKNARSPARSICSSGAPGGTTRVADAMRPDMSRAPSRVAARKQASLSTKCA
jgi:uncharacterized membrane protein YeiH